MSEKLQEIKRQLEDMHPAESCVSYVCGRCGAISSYVDINEHTINTCCINRKQRRKYMPIEKTKYGDAWAYRCPSCGDMVSRRNGWKDADFVYTHLTKNEEDIK